jgi:two-component system KDP operon response regulator KdpE
MVAKSRVLVVDAHTDQDLGQVLTLHGYQVRTSSETESALSSFDEFRPHLVFTDRHLPRVDGIELCRRIRAISKVPVVVIADNGAEIDKVEAFDSGADDYVTKPYGANELLARVHVNGVEIRLTPKEFNLFVYLARHPNRVIEHARLLQAVWGEAAQDHPEYLWVFIRQLRKKLEADAARPRYLLTEAWVGYRFNPHG